MPKLTEEQLNRAREMFLASVDGAEARKRIEALTQSDAEFMETSLEKLRAARTLDEIASFAHTKRIDSMELLFSLASQDAEEFDLLCKAHNEEVKRVLGS
ncbi:DUF6388 family protein [Massilia sp. LjRoot122]|uniref:DUF6388 family protein n=1 Tax=Massilia sp. LjRoot122 TaxID=3342257 RepID=UPI003ED04FDB